VPKHILEQDLKAIEQQIAVSHKGIGISELEAALATAGITMNRRSLLRRISILIESNRIRATGAFKGRVYWPLKAAAAGGTELEESSRFSVANQSAINAIFSFPIRTMDRISTTPLANICTVLVAPIKGTYQQAPWPARSWTTVDRPFLGIQLSGREYLFTVGDGTPDLLRPGSGGEGCTGNPDDPESQTGHRVSHRIRRRNRFQQVFDTESSCHPV